MRLQKNNIRPFHLFLALSLVCLILFVLIFGAYGVGYIPVDPMYANF